MLLFTSLALLLIHMHPCTRAQLSDSFYGWEVRASAQPTNAPAQTQPHYPMPSREVRSTKPPAQTPPRATRHPQRLERTRHLPANTFRDVASQHGLPPPAPSLLLLVVGILVVDLHHTYTQELRGARRFAAPRTNRTARLQTGVR